MPSGSRTKAPYAVVLTTTAFSVSPTECVVLGFSRPPPPPGLPLRCCCPPPDERCEPCDESTKLTGAGRTRVVRYAEP